MEPDLDPDFCRSGQKNPDPKHWVLVAPPPCYDTVLSGFKCLLLLPETARVVGLAHGLQYHLHDQVAAMLANF